jgi:hypothetical protein
VLGRGSVAFWTSASRPARLETSGDGRSCLTVVVSCLPLVRGPGPTPSTLLRRGRQRRSGPPRPGSGSAGRARQGRSRPRPPACKARSAAVIACEDGERRRSGLLRVVRGCPLDTSQDRCGWHGSGTDGEDDVREAWLCRHQLDRRVRLDPATPASLARAAGPRQGSVGFDLRVGHD